MTWWHLFGGTLAALTVWLDLKAALALFRTTEISTVQKIAQFAIVICLPIIGAITIIHLLNEDSLSYRKGNPYGDYCEDVLFSESNARRGRSSRGPDSNADEPAAGEGD